MLGLHNQEARCPDAVALRLLLGCADNGKIIALVTSNVRFA